MLTFQFDINPSVPLDPKEVKRKDGKLIVDIEGDFSIFINGRTFFSDPYIHLLELGIALTKWDRENDFEYHTISFDGGPILAFYKYGDHLWRLYSIWQEYEGNTYVTNDELRKVVSSFLKELDESFMEKYKFKVKDFIEPSWIRKLFRK